MFASGRSQTRIWGVTARLLGCQIFSGSVDAIVAKNWIKKVSDTMVVMELEDTLKLRVATRLLD